MTRRLLTMPIVPDDDLEDLPAEALKNTRSSKYKSITKAGKEREGVQAYLACISFIDVQVGLVLDAHWMPVHMQKTPLWYSGETMAGTWERRATGAKAPCGKKPHGRH